VDVGAKTGRIQEASLEIHRFGKAEFGRALGPLAEKRSNQSVHFVDSLPVSLCLALARTARMIVLGERLRNMFDGFLDPTTIVVISNGIDYQQFMPPEPGAATRPVGKRLLYLSNLRKRKGLFLILEALPKVLARYPDGEMTFAGRWWNEAVRVEAEQLVRRLGLAQSVRFVGVVTGTEKTRVFHEHDVFVFTPVEPEGLPWVILEAMSASLPVVTTDQGAMADVVEDSKTGLIVLPTPEMVAEGICWLLDNPARAREMGAQGRKRIEEHFSE
jgi:glycosyltransferase involved in cell wall biosynthesis